MALIMRLVGMISVAVWIYSLIDVITTSNGLTRNLPKGTWVFIVIFGSIVGAGAWLAFGRPEKAGYLPGDTNYRQPLNFSRGPDDNPDFLRNLNQGPPSSPSPPAANAPRGGEPDNASMSTHPAAGAGRSPEELEAWAADLRRREEDLRRREAGDS